MTLDELLSASAERYSTSKVITFPGCTLTYGALQSWVNCLAARFHAMGIRKGDTASILLDNSPDFVAVYFAIVRLGATAVPLNTFLKRTEIACLVTDSRSRLLVTSTQFADTVAPLREAVEYVVLVDAEDNNYVTHTQAATASFDPLPTAHIGADDPATIIYTSGTTGYPKGVVLSQRNLTANVESCREFFPLTADDRFLLFLPMFHTFTLTANVLLPIALGARIVLCTSARPFARLLKRIATERVSVIAAVPAFYRALTKARFPGLSLLIRSVRFCVSASAPLPEATIVAFEKRFRCPILEGYGLSEAAPVVSLNPYDGQRKAGSVGIPIPGIEVRILDDDGQPVRTGTVGEIAVQGPNVMDGYLRMPEETAKVLRDGWLLTGDLGYKDEDGFIFIVDRKKDLILHRGMNVYPREIEEVLAKHPDIVEAAVVGYSHDSHGEVPHAYVILDQAASLTAQQVKDYCARYLADFKTPRAVHFVTDVPRTATGKIAKRKLVPPCES